MAFAADHFLHIVREHHLGATLSIVRLVSQCLREIVPEPPIVRCHIVRLGSSQQMKALRQAGDAL
jgi:hypothetical protein